MENGIFTLDTGASGRSIGAVLSQLQSGKERVIGFASRTVTVTGIFLLSQEHSQRDQIYVFKILFNCTVTPSPNSVCTYGTRFSTTILYRYVKTNN
jgi:hypothetical protein